MSPDGDSNPPATVSQTDSSELTVAESPLGQKAASAEEAVASLGSLQGASVVARVPLMPDSAEMQVEKARNGKVENLEPAAVLAAVPGSSVELSRSELKEPRNEDKTRTPESLAQPTVARPTATSPDPSFVLSGSQEHMQAVAHDSPLAPDIPKVEILEQSSIPTLAFAEASPATFGPRANTATLSLACPTTQKAFDSQLASGIDAHKAQDSETRKQWKLIAACGALLFAAGVGGVLFFHRESLGDGVVGSTLAPGLQAITRSNPVAHVDPKIKNFKTVSTDPPKETTPSPSVRSQREQSAPTKQSIPSVTSDMFEALSAHPVSTRPAATAQAATASSSDAGIVFSDENSNAPLGITSSSDDVVPPSPAYKQDLPFSVGGQVKQPELLSSVLPEYPPVARQWRVEGDVIVNFVVEESGNVSDIEVVSGPMMVRQAALKALRSWKYKPAQLNGQPTAVKMQVTIRFRLP
jgi:protein TonB